MPDDLPPLRSACHLLPLDLPSQVVLYPPGGRRFGVEDSPETPCVRANRSLLRQILSTNAGIQWGKQAVAVEDDGTKATVRFQDGTSATGDIVIGADGTWSKGLCFARVAVSLPPHLAGEILWLDHLPTT